MVKACLRHINLMSAIHTPYTLKNIVLYMHSVAACYNHAITVLHVYALVHQNNIYTQKNPKNIVNKTAKKSEAMQLNALKIKNQRLPYCKCMVC